MRSNGPLHQVFEVAYTQPSCKVELEAARQICLMRGQVQLVIAIDIVHRAKTMISIPQLCAYIFAILFEFSGIFNRLSD